MKTVLILEDDRTSLAVLKAILESEYRIITAEVSDDAIAVCNTQRPPDLFVSDNVLRSTASGLQTSLRIHESVPLMPVLILSGTAPEGWSDRDFDCFTKLVAGASIVFLQKPFTASQLRRTVKDLIDGNADLSETREVFEEASHYRGTPRAS
jgi:DNA-binding NtrC family response regulator